MDIPALTKERIAQLRERIPPIFERLPDRLFAPLASPNRHRYWSLLCSLHNERFGPDAPLPPSHGFPMSEITKAIGEEIKFFAWDLEEGITPATPLDIRSIGVFNKLRDAGWLRVDRVGVRDMVSMPPVVAHFMTRIMDFARTGPLFVAGKIRSIEANLKLLIQDPDVGGDTLNDTAEQTRSLLDSVRNTGTTVRDLMHEIARSDDTKAFVRRFFDEFVERVFIGDYKELRTREHPLSRRQEILRLVQFIHQDAAIRQRMLHWYQNKKASGDAARAEFLFERDIQRIDDLRRIDEYLDRLDEEIRVANRRALAYLNYRTRSSRALDALIEQAIASVAQEPDATKLAPFAPGYCIEPNRLAEPRVESQRKAPGALRKTAISPYERARAYLQLAASDRRRMPPHKLAAFVRDQAKDGFVTSEQMPVDSIEAIRALQVLSVVASAHASGSRHFKQMVRSYTSGFEVVAREEKESGKGFTFQAFELELKRRAPIKSAVPVGNPVGNPDGHPDGRGVI